MHFIDVLINDHNSKVYIDLLNDMRDQGDGVFTCNLRVDYALINDCAVIRSDSYANTRPTSNGGIHRPEGKTNEVRDANSDGNHPKR